ncbi:hypothetical protein R3I94_013577 [Phoxinus phoxinus]
MFYPEPSLVLPIETVGSTKRHDFLPTPKVNEQNMCGCWDKPKWKSVYPVTNGQLCSKSKQQSLPSHCLMV